MLHRHSPLHYKHLFASNSDTESDEMCNHSKSKKPKGKGKRKRTNGKNQRDNKGEAKLIHHEDDRVAEPLKADPDALVKLATMYQEEMKNIPIPETHLYQGMFVTWLGLAKSLKNLHKQPLHYSTLELCKKWDGSRFGSVYERLPMEEAMPGRQAEQTIWTVERVYRLGIGISPIDLARSWYEDPEYHAFVDEVILN